MRIGSYGHVKDRAPQVGSWTIYHNPRCSKSCQAVDLLRAEGHDIKVIEYLEQPLDKAGLEYLLSILNVETKEILRTNDPLVETLGLKLDDKEAILKAIVENPQLLQRPIVVRNGRAVIGRPPEKIWELL